MMEDYLLKKMGATWWHSDDQHSPNLSKTSLGLFFNTVLSIGAQIGDVWVFNRHYKSSSVFVTIFATEQMIQEIESKTKFRFRPPPKIRLN